MGHTFDTGEQKKASKDIRLMQRLTASETRKSYIPRSPIVSSQKDELRDFGDYLKNQRPPTESYFDDSALDLTRANSKRKKHPIEEIFRTGYLSPKQFRQMIQTRRQTRSASPARRLTKDVVLQKSVGGREYLQIVNDPMKLRSSDNISAFEVNRRREEDEEFPLRSNATTARNMMITKTVEIPTTVSDNIPTKTPHIAPQSDTLGIARSFPHFISSSITADDLETKRIEPEDQVLGMASGVPRQRDEPTVRDFAAQMSDAIFDSRNVDRQANHVTNDIPAIINPTLGHIDRKDVLAHESSQTRFNEPHMWMCSDTKTHTNNAQTVSQKYTRRFDDQASHTFPRIVVPQHPIVDGRSKHSSKTSASESMAQSDASSGVVMNAQSLEVTRAQGADTLYGAGRRKAPRPSGPAPTRALPLLPEGRDPTPAVQRISTSNPNEGAEAIAVDEGKWIAVPPRSPARKAGHRTSGLGNRGKLVLPIRSATCPDLQYEEPVFTTLPNEALYPRYTKSEIPNATPEALDKWKRKREQHTKERKKRDLGIDRALREQQKSARELGSIEVEAERVSKTKEDRDDTVVALPSLRGSSSTQSPSFSTKSPTSRFSVGSTSSQTSSQFAANIHHGSRLSPIVTLANQRPVNVFQPPTKQLPERAKPVRSISKPRIHHRSQILDEGHRRRSHSPSLPSSDEAGMCKHSERTATRLSARRSRSSIKRGSVLSDSSIAEDSKANENLPASVGQESNLEARLAAFERRTAVLEALVLALINPAAPCGVNTNLSYGDRSSGPSGRSSLYAPLESRLESMIATMDGTSKRAEY
ncbi:hypothetical protein MMC09_001946 [Bachmanniomyces sp. S44760]|nr:hypothetical protein [Bachmanniomyces sp. S44760]